MKKNKEGILKSKDYLKIGRKVAFTGMGLSILTLLGTVGALIGHVSINKNKDEYLTSVSQTAQYQEYYEDEKSSLEEALASKEITSDDFIVKYDALKNNGTEKYIEEKGSEEQKASIEKYENQDKAAATVSKVFRYINYGALGFSLSSLIFVCVGAKKSKKEIQEKVDAMYSSYTNSSSSSPFPELDGGFESDTVALPSIDDENEND